MRFSSPFDLRIGQVFTGFGFGCGFGIGIGRNVNLREWENEFDAWIRIRNQGWCGATIRVTAISAVGI